MKAVSLKLGGPLLVGAQTFVVSLLEMRMVIMKMKRMKTSNMMMMMRKRRRTMMTLMIDSIIWLGVA